MAGEGRSTHHVFIATGNDVPGTVGDNDITPGATYSYETVTMTTSGKEIDNNRGKCYTVTIVGCRTRIQLPAGPR